jgi:predicted amidohydrolase YtcJ
MTRLVFTHATVIDGDGSTLTEAHVVVDGDRIAAVGKRPGVHPAR